MAVAACASAPASAQGLQTLGTRAAGSGAFVAVADDASAAAWNPAGLINGPIFNVLIDFGRLTTKPEASLRGVDAGTPAGRSSTSMIALGTLPLGLAYYRVRQVEFAAAGPAVAEGQSREDRQVIVRSLVTTNVGATVLQSLGDALTVGATVRLVRGSAAVGRISTSDWETAFDRVEALPEEGSTTFDLDAGAMYSAGRIRAGLVVRNLRQPSFAAPPDESAKVRVDRHARIGVAWGDAWPGITRWIVAADADLTEVPHPSGNRRDLAAGVERWLRQHTLGVRGGVRASTVGGARPVATAGVSYAVRAGLFVEGHVGRGRSEDLGWGIAARLAY